MKTNSAITLFNRYVDPDTRNEVFYRFEIRDVYWESKKGSQFVSTGGLMRLNNAIMVIPMHGHINQYLLPLEWRSSSAKSGLWTLQEGDIVVSSIVPESLSSTFTVTDLMEKYDEVYTILGVDDMTTGSRSIWHWYVGLK